MTLKPHFVRIFTAAIIVAAAAALPASANDWKPWADQDAAAPRVIYTDDTNVQGAVLACQKDGVLTAMVTSKPGSLPELMAKNAPYSRSEKAEVSVGNEAPASVDVRLIPAINVVEARTHLVAAKVFNATVLGEEFNMKITHGDNISTTFPAPNDTFKAFATACKAARESGESS